MNQSPRHSSDLPPHKRNHLLSLLPDEQQEALFPRFDLVTLELGQILFEPDEAVTHVYFPLDCMLSLSVILRDGSAGEVATIGDEGLFGTPIVLGTESLSFQALCQAAGDALRMRSADFQAALAEDPELTRLALRHTQALLTQVGQSAVCNRLHPIEERCARWLLMTHDRLREPEFTTTHEFLAEMLGVRRASVSVAAGELQKAGLIQYSRGRVTIVDRAGLEAASCECYFVIAREYWRLLGWSAAR